MEAEHAAPPLPDLPTLWLEVLAGPVAWSLHLLVIYALSWAACSGDWQRIDGLGVSLWVFVASLVTALAAGVVVLAAIWAWRDIRELRAVEARQPDDGTPLYDRAGRSRFMALLGLLLAAISLLAIVKQFIPAIRFPPC